MKYWRRIYFLLAVFSSAVCTDLGSQTMPGGSHSYNGPYEGEHLNRVAFPIGGIGTGMVALEGSGAISHVSVRNQLDFFNEPCMFAAVSVKGMENAAKIVEGPVPEWKYFGGTRTGNGSPRSGWGLPRFEKASFTARFPFGQVELEDGDLPLKAEITGWNPFIPLDADNSSLPVGTLEYSFTNTSEETVEAVFSYHTRNFISVNNKNGVLPLENGFILFQEGSENSPENEGYFAFWIDEGSALTDHCWFKGSHYDDLTLLWKTIKNGETISNPPQDGASPGASLYSSFSLKPGERKTITLRMAWYVPHTTLRYGRDPKDLVPAEGTKPATYVPWYAGRFGEFSDLISYFREHAGELREKSALFSETFYNTDLPSEVVEAVAANLTILKSPTVLRQTDGRIWAFEGCSDDRGCCPGSCTHVWNYAQAIPHLFPGLERTFRQTEFYESQSEYGRQTFRSLLPIRPASHEPDDYIAGRFAAADGQLGGIMKVYREWRISGDTQWLKGIWPRVKSSMDYCIETWDPRRRGIMDEPQHNTYDIQFWGPNGMLGSFYLGALRAITEMGNVLKEETSGYTELYRKGRAFMESELFNGEYFIQKVQTEGLNATFVPLSTKRNGKGYGEIIEQLNREGPKYQYGTGCLSDGVLGAWMASACGLDDIIDKSMLRSHLLSIYRYNLKKDLSDHSNPQRPAYAMGSEGGLLLCTWPHGGEISLPFIYSNEVWTGIEYQVASHLMMEGLVEEGLDIVRTCRNRYDGTIRNPFNEYECGHWYARAMSSYALIQGLTGVRYDAVTRTLYIDSRIGDNFRSFFSGQTGYGMVGLENGKPFVKMVSGRLDVKKCIVSGKEVRLSKTETK